MISNSSYRFADYLERISTAPIFPLTAVVADQIKNKEQEIFVLGTDAAAKSKNYGHLLGSLGIPFQYPNADDQAHLQNWIQRLKQGQLSSWERDRFLEFIKSVTKTKPKLLLGCTELSLYRIPEELRKVGLEIIDSEDVLVQSLAKKIMSF